MVTFSPVGHSLSICAAEFFRAYLWRRDNDLNEATAFAMIARSNAIGVTLIAFECFRRACSGDVFNDSDVPRFVFFLRQKELSVNM